ncbi:TetR/AcrR family transcriptional regulator [Pseudonocardia sp. C8]|uniref:TetR/AcrR family transcriptional regulator n=1 Tax=Pseudonocardia sp. C8 TaxID=2762759 RepID=UPI0016431EF9|nr:TetR/AcrR family transcriptional regulator [Pseudonocardia sp. C8]MBC3193101.1 TetR/AcrR family transcriptional regulator [Pseudonocardia sp. C8]
MSKRDDILTTAERLFDRQGFHGTGIDQIVREAGVTPRTLYRHFPSKEQLVVEVLQQREERFLGRLEHGLDPDAGTEPDRASLFAELESWFSEESDRGCLFLRALAEYGHKDAEITRRVLRHKQRGLEHLYARLEDSHNSPDELRDKAEGLMLIMEGAVALAPVIGGSDAARRARRLADRLLANPPRTDLDRRGA